MFIQDPPYRGKSTLLALFTLFVFPTFAFAQLDKGEGLMQTAQVSPIQSPRPSATPTPRPCTVNADCNDRNLCTIDTCTAAGTCSSAPVAPGSFCVRADGSTGSCANGPQGIQCDCTSAAQCGTNDSCNSYACVNGVCTANVDVGAQCNEAGPGGCGWGTCSSTGNCQPVNCSQSQCCMGNNPPCETATCNGRSCTHVFGDGAACDTCSAWSCVCREGHCIPNRATFTPAPPPIPVTPRPGGRP